jgi:hypothetical protein
MSIVPPASATLVWAFPTKFEDVRCIVWEQGSAGWVIVVMFGEEPLALEMAPTRQAMQAGVNLVWRGLLSSGLGKAAAESPTLAAMSPPDSDAQVRTAERANDEDHTDGSTQHPMQRVARDRRAEDSLRPHTPFRHPEPSFDSEPSNPPPRRRPH